MALTNQESCSFATCYAEMCRRQQTRPLSMICLTLPHSLDFTTDRVKMDDWIPILNSISLDRNLKSITVRSKYPNRKLYDDATTESKARAIGKSPVILTRYLIEWLTHSLSQCLRNSVCLHTLELDGIPIPADCLAALCVGIAGTKTLQNLSLQRCLVGDEGCDVLCRTVADVRSLRTLNLANCELTSKSGQVLAGALSKQKLYLYQEAWKQSLRYREPNFHNMQGLRRLTLNGNPKLGDDSFKYLIEAIRDSLWFKALDLQQCGVTESISNDLFELLEHNHCIVILDVRLNPALREATLTELSRLLTRNEMTCGKPNDYRWSSLPKRRQSQLDVNGCNKTTKQTNALLNRRVLSTGNLQAANRHNGPSRVPDGSEQVASRSQLSRSRSATFRQQRAKRPAATSPIVRRKSLILAPTPQSFKRLKIKPPLPTFERRPRQPVKPPPLRLPIQSVAPVTKVSLRLGANDVVYENYADDYQDERDENEQEQEDEEDEEEEDTERIMVEELRQIIRRKFALIVNKAKSESMKRGSRGDVDRQSSGILSRTAAKYGISEGNVRSHNSGRKSTTTTPPRSRTNVPLVDADVINALPRIWNGTRSPIQSVATVAKASSHSDADDEVVYDSYADDCVEERDEEEEEEEEEKEEEEEDEDEDAERIMVEELRQSIRRKFALIVKKAKSENLKRVEQQSSTIMTRTAAKYGISEGNIRHSSGRRSTKKTTKPGLRMNVPPVDTDEINALPRIWNSMRVKERTRFNNNGSRCNRSGNNKNNNFTMGDHETPGDRARAIFARLVNGELDLRR